MFIPRNGVVGVDEDMISASTDVNQLRAWEERLRKQVLEMQLKISMGQGSEKKMTAVTVTQYLIEKCRRQRAYSGDPTAILDIDNLEIIVENIVNKLLVKNESKNRS